MATMLEYFPYLARLTFIGLIAFFSFVTPILLGLTMVQLFSMRTYMLFFLMATFLMMIFCAIVFFLSLRGIILTVLFLRNPSKYLLQDFSKSLCTKEYGAFKDLVATLATRVNVRCPRIEIVQEQLIAFTYGISRNNTNLVVSENLIKTLDKDELKAVVLHELFHVKYGDVETRTLMFAHRRMFHPQYFKFFTYFAANLVVWILFFSFIISLFPFLLPQASIILSGFRCVALVLIGVPPFVVLLIVLYIWKQGIGSSRYIYLNELLADGFSLAHSMKPTKLRSAILKMTSLRQIPKSSPESISSFSNLIKSKLIEKADYAYIKEVLTLKRTLPRLKDIVLEKMDYRFCFIELVEKLMLKASKLNVITPHQDKLKRSCPKPVSDLVKSRRSQYEDFLEYASRNANHFNLIDCSKHLEIEPFEALLFLWAAAHSNVMDLYLT